MKVNNTESTVAQPKPKSVANNAFVDRKCPTGSSQPQIAPKPIQNLKRSSHGVQNDTELLPKVQKMTKPVEIRPAPVKDNTEVVQFTYDDKEETSSSNSEKQAADLLADDDAVEEISIDEIPALTGNESGLIKIETDQFEQLPVSYR